jgi:hypothetical protein
MHGSAYLLEAGDDTLELGDALVLELDGREGAGPVLLSLSVVFHTVAQPTSANRCIFESSSSKYER